MKVDRRPQLKCMILQSPICEEHNIWYLLRGNHPFKMHILNTISVGAISMNYLSQKSLWTTPIYPVIQHDPVHCFLTCLYFVFVHYW